MLVNYTEAQIEQNLREAMGEYASWDSNSQFLSDYANGMSSKNESLQKMFDGTDGRIVITDSDVQISRDTIFKAELSEYVKSSDFHYDLVEKMPGERSSVNGYIDYVREGLNGLVKNFDFQDKKLIGKGPFKNHSFHGQRITKAIMSIFEANILLLELREGTPEDSLKTVIDHIKNVIIGGKIASMGGGGGLKNKKLVISIRPEDFFLMSVGNSWRSCLHPDGGEYSNGTLGYIHAKDAFIAYLLDETDDFLSPRIWRQMMYISDSGVLVSQKGYPQKNEFYSRIINETATSLLGWRSFKDVKKEVRRIKNKEHGYDDEGYGYIDILRYSFDTALTGALIEEGNVEFGEDDRIVALHLQDKLTCLACGEHTWDAGSQYGLCEYCEEHSSQCDYCGAHRDEDDLIPVESSYRGVLYFCPEHEGEEFFCSIDGDYISSSSAVYIEDEGGYILSDDAILAGEGVYIRKEDAASPSHPDYKYAIRLSDAVLLDGYYVLESDKDLFSKWRIDGKTHLGQEESAFETKAYKDLLDEVHYKAIEYNKRMTFSDPVEALAKEIRRTFLSDKETFFIAEFLFEKAGIKAVLNEEESRYRIKKDENDTELISQLMGYFS